MFLDYLVNNKLYLKKDISIQCAEIIDDVPNGVPYDFTWSDIHEWVELKEVINILSIDNNEFLFVKDDKKYIYWCDVSIFFKLRCKNKAEIREMNLNKILE